MKKTTHFRSLLALFAAIVPLGLCHAQTTFFSDNFSTSTTNQISIAGGTPASSSTSYDLASTKNVVSTIGPNLLHLTLSGATSSGFLEAQALFATNPISLNVVGDYIEIDVVFTNSAGDLFVTTATGSSLDLGLFNSGSTFGVITNWPVPFGGLAGSGLGGSAFPSGFCEPWQGYFGQVLSNSAPDIITRPIQNEGGTTSANQDLLGNGAGGGLFNQPVGTTIGKGTSVPLTLDVTDPYTITLRITETGPEAFVISNAIYQGAGTAGTLLSSSIAPNVSGVTNIASAFDGFSVGLRCVTSKTATVNPVMDISSISIFGQSTIPTVPPTITQQPVPTMVATNGSCAMSVTVIADNPQFQWYRNNTKLSAGGNISINNSLNGGATSELIISNATTVDQFSGNNGYYCVIAQGPVPSLFVDSMTNALTLIPATNLVWAAAGNTASWDINTSAEWLDPNNNSAVFNYGDPVVFNDNGGPSEAVITGNYVSPSSVTVSNDANAYLFDGNGSIAGPCSFNIIGSGQVSLNANNIYTGGTLISNAAANVILENYASFGTGPVTFGMAGGQMEIEQTGSSSTGIAGNVNVNDNFTIISDIDSSFGVVLLDNLAGVSGKTLTFNPGTAIGTITNQLRVRVYGQNTTYNGNLNLNDSHILFATYEAAGTQTYNGTITGPGGFMQKGTTTILNNGNSTFSGGTSPAQGAIGLGASSSGSGGSPTSGPIGTGPILLLPDSTSTTAGDGFVFSTINNLTLANSIEYQSSTNNLTLEVGGTNNITFTGPFSFNGQDGSAINATYTFRTLTVTNTGLTTFTGVISDGGKGYGFELTGSGTTLFNNTETYTGPTTNTGGTLLINGQIGGAVFIETNSTVGGTGTMTGSVTNQTGGTITAGSETAGNIPTIGTLHIGGALDFQGNSKAFLKVNTGNVPQNDVIAVTGAVTYNGTLNVTNMGAALTTANTFTIFTAGSESGNFTNIVGSPGPNLGWTFNPATGVLGVTTLITPFTVSPAITNIVLNGTTLTISGMNGQSGDTYYLYTATNLAVNPIPWTPISTNVAAGANFSFTVPGGVFSSRPQQYYKFINVP